MNLRMNLECMVDDFLLIYFWGFLRDLQGRAQEPKGYSWQHSVVWFRGHQDYLRWAVGVIWFWG